MHPHAVVVPVRTTPQSNNKFELNSYKESYTRTQYDYTHTEHKTHINTRHHNILTQLEQNSEQGRRGLNSGQELLITSSELEA